MDEPQATPNNGVGGRNIQTKRNEEMITQLENQIIQMISICVALEGLIFASIFTDHSPNKCQFWYLPAILALFAGGICIHVIVVKTLQVKDLMTPPPADDPPPPTAQTEPLLPVTDPRRSDPSGSASTPVQLPAQLADQGYTIATTALGGDGLRSWVFLNPPPSTAPLPPFKSWGHLCSIVVLCIIFVLCTAAACKPVCCIKPDPTL